MARYSTVGEKLLWSYANLCMAHAAVDAGAESFGPQWYRIRNYMWTQFRDGEFGPRTLADDEKIKMRVDRHCIYCGATDDLTADHLIPSRRGGPDTGDNLVRACRSCNSSKGNRDMMQWYAGREEFPPLLLLRRYLKLCVQLTAVLGLQDQPLDETGDLPFAMDVIPTKFPAPRTLRLAVTSG